MDDVGEEDEDGAIMFGLYSSPTSTHKREPMEQEVAWFPQFNTPYMEAETKKVKLRMQNIDLHNAWKYLMERDPEKVIQFEEALNKPQKRRWQSFFENARAFKRKRATAAKYRTKRRVTNQKHKQLKDRLIAAGVDSALIGDDLSTDEDSAYESDEEPHVNPRARATSMAPPVPAPKATRKKAAPAAKGRGRKKPSDSPSIARRTGGSSMSGGAGTGPVRRGQHPLLDRFVKTVQPHSVTPSESLDFDTGTPEPNLPMRVDSGEESEEESEEETEPEEERHERIAGFRAGLPLSPDSQIARRYNGNVTDEHAAIQQAVAESEANKDHGFDPDQIERAMRASLQPENRPSGVGGDE
jgi:hypothetical protein